MGLLPRPMPLDYTGVCQVSRTANAAAHPGLEQFK